MPAGAYDIAGPDTTSYRDLLKTYARVSGSWHAGLPVGRIDTTLASLITGVALPVPQGLAGDLVESLDHPMVASASGLRDRVPDPPGGLLGVDDSIALALAGGPNAGRDRSTPWPTRTTSPTPIRLGRRGRAAHPAARPGGDAAGRAARPWAWSTVPGPLAGAVRTGLDILIALTPKVRPHDPVDESVPDRRVRRVAPRDHQCRCATP